AGIVAETIVDLFEVVGVNEIENDVAIAAAARGVGSGVRANGLAYVARDGGLEETAIASGGERIGEGHFLELFVGLCEGFAAFGDGFFEPESFALQFAGAVIHHGIQSKNA